MEITIKQYEISIVVLGTFQPSKITPKWMFNNGVVSAGEWKQLQENMMVSPPASKFQFGDIEFICQQERIQVRTADISKSGRLQQMVSVIVDLCNQTELVALGVNSELKFTFLTENKSSVWNEFIESLKNAGKKRCAQVLANQLLYETKLCQLYSLSPSDKMLEIMEHTLIRYDKANGDMADLDEHLLPPNLCCTAFILRTPNGDVLLGSDLEANRKNTELIDECIDTCGEKWEKGWCNVMEKSISFKERKITYFKLPHHSSSTGFCRRIWNEHTEEKVTSVSTIFVNNKGVMLPNYEMLQRYYDLSGDMFLTSKGPRRKNGRDKNCKLVKEGEADISSIVTYPEEIGIVCSQKKADTPWQTTLIGTAVAVDQKFIDNYKTIYSE